ncbi:MAG: ABC-2 family transporter protein [Fimbriimonadaceae bacterium]|nr:ABC-2 family transporter protein [Fimbriimonadaceae bacterium]QYK58737.1 MAG: ABC-2 family transporter protein [Fimbriimonadaceae bacterium]
MGWRAMWRQTLGLIRIYIADGLAYRASGVIWVLTDVASAVTMPLVWLAASRGGPIAGYSSSDLVLYYLCLLMLTSFIMCHFMWEISFEIREGMFSAHIIRPVSYMHFILSRNLAWRVVRSLIFLPFFLAILYFYLGAVEGKSVYLGWELWASVVLGHLVSVVFVTALAMIALFTQEAQSIFELYYFPMLFLSGQLFPIALLPDWVRGLAVVFPFYYTTGVPTEIMVGRLAGPAAWQAMGIQVVWIGVSYVLFRVLFAKGTRHYAGVGM